MGRPNAPWYRTAKDGWYVTLGGRTHSLNVKGAGNKSAAETAFEKLKAQQPPATQSDAGDLRSPSLPLDRSAVAALLESVFTSALNAVRQWNGVSSSPTTDISLADLFAQFLTDAHRRLKPKTVSRYQSDTDAFQTACGPLPARSLTHKHIRSWLNTLKGSSTTKAIALRSLSAALGWAVREDIIPANPATKVPKPKSRSRSAEVMISPADHQKLLAVASDRFKEVLTVLQATGCRPGEIAQFTAHNFHPDQKAVVISEHKTDKSGRQRVVYLPDGVVELLKRKVAAHPTGPIFRTQRGNAWSGRSITGAMLKLKRKAGVTSIAYGYRHTFVTDALAGGVPTAVVASLVGHTGTSVIDKHYSHLGAKADTLRAAMDFRKTEVPTPPTGEGDGK